MTPRFREATPEDAAFIAAMLAEAATWDRPAGEPAPPVAEILADPGTADYIEGWGRDGDAGIVAKQAGEPVGACWFRSFTTQHPGYGFLGENVPGIGLAVHPEHRGRGIGARLLRETIDLARRRGVTTLSISVAQRNPARRLYRRAGFVEVGPEGDSLTMRLDLGTGEDDQG
jgi:ribosomal protein S18 acetylase RimI-like enzyme